jgi:hypothetical protein
VTLTTLPHLVPSRSYTSYLQARTWRVEGLLYFLHIIDLFIQIFDYVLGYRIPLTAAKGIISFLINLYPPNLFDWMGKTNL